jgi:hypothetical protein
MRRLLILAVCLNVAFGAVCGMHAHLERGIDAVSGSAIYSIHVEPEIGPTHESDHDETGEIDISLLAKLVGSLAALALLFAVAVIGGILWPAMRESRLHPRAIRPLAMPPMQRLIYYLHPPSHAPPFPAH